MTDEVFLVQLKSKKSLAKVLSTSKDVVESTGELLYTPSWHLYGAVMSRNVLYSYGMAWYGMILYNMVQLWCNKVVKLWFDILHYGIAWHDMIRHS